MFIKKLNCIFLRLIFFNTIYKKNTYKDDYIHIQHTENVSVLHSLIFDTIQFDTIQFTLLNLFEITNLPEFGVQPKQRMVDIVGVAEIVPELEGYTRVLSIGHEVGG